MINKLIKLRCGIIATYNTYVFQSNGRSFQYLDLQINKFINDLDKVKLLGELFLELFERGYLIRRIKNQEECYEDSCQTNIQGLVISARKELK